MEGQIVHTSRFFVRSYKASQGLRQTFRGRTRGLKSSDMKLKTVRRAVQRVETRTVGVESAISAKNIENELSVLHGLGHIGERV